MTVTHGSEKRLFPDFVREVTSGEVRVRHWRHNATSWATIPCRWLPRPQSAGTCGILMYHRICPRPNNRFSPTYSVTPSRFAKQLAGLIRRGYRPFSLTQLVEAQRAGTRLSEKAFAVTFDDGYANNLLYALPVLIKLNVPATLFLATAYVGETGPFPFDDWMINAPNDIPEDAWRPLTLDECHRMRESKLMEIGAHTHTHQDFRNNIEHFRGDLKQCLEFLRQQFSIDRPSFAYPFGDPQSGFASVELADIAAQLECKCAVQTGNRCVRATDDLFHIPRFDVAPCDNGASLAAKLDGWSECLRNSLKSLRNWSFNGAV